MKLFEKGNSLKKFNNEVKKMKLNKLLALLLALVMVLSLAACGGQPTEPTEPTDPTAPTEPTEPTDGAGRAINVHLTAGLESIDPAFTSAGDDFEVIGTMVEGLFRAEVTGKAVPGIAESYEVSEDGLTWTFHLRDAKWSNGDPVTADDFVYAWTRCLTIPAQYVDLFATANIKNAAAIAAGEADVSEFGAYAVDEKTFVVELDRPCAFFDTLMFFPVFYPVNRAFAEKCGDLYGTAPEYYLSNGPFVLTSYEPAATSFTLAKNEDYYAADGVKIAGINYKVILDNQQAYLAYQNGELDICVLSSELAEILNTDPEFTPVRSGYLWYLSPNVEKNEDLANLNIRKAIGMAFDKEAVVNSVLKDGSIVVNSCVPYELAAGPDGQDYRATSPVSYCEYDVAAAQELWAKGLEELGKDKIEMTLIYDESESVKMVAEFIQAQLQTNLPGLTFNIQSYPKKERSDLMKAHDYDIGLTRWGPDYADPLTYMDLWTDGYTHNYGNWHSDAYMELINNVKFGELAADVEARWAAFYELEQMIADDAVILPVYQACNANLVKAEVKGIEFHSVGLNRVFREVTIG